ncbi:MAG: PAS domain S-box protein, partial [Anaerolineaceae bacterium]
IVLYWRSEQQPVSQSNLRDDMLAPRFQNLLQTTNALIFLLDEAGNILDANEGAARKLNLTLSRLTELRMADLVDLGGCGSIRDLLDRADENSSESFEAHCIGSDGKSFPVVGSISQMVYENRKYYQVVMQDVTEQERMEEDLRESEQRFHMFSEQTPVRYQTLDAEGHLLDVNQAWLDWMQIPDKSQVIGSAFSNWLAKEDRGLFTRQFKILKNAGFVRSIELRMPSESGRLVYVILHGRATFDAQGQFILAHCILQDITAQKQAEDSIRRLNEELEARVLARTTQLEAANKELEAFSYSVSHDLRAPLRAMDGFSRILMEEYADQLDEEARHYLDLVRQNTVSMSQLIDDLLAFSRLSRQPLSEQRVQPSDLVQQALEVLATDLSGREIEIHVEDMPECEADPILLKQVYVNLISNAIKFTRKTEHAVVDVGALHEDHRNIYFVKDNGVGFDMQYAPKIFGVFQRLHRVEDYEGTGVGLAIVQRIVRRHHGEVWAQGAVNEGATFCFTLNDQETLKDG